MTIATKGITDRAGWPVGKHGAVVFTVDDVHPGTSDDAYEAGGDLERGALGHLLWLLGRHPRLRTTLFVTADWREISPVPTRSLLGRLPVVRDRVYLTPILARGTMRLDRHPDFVRFLKSMPRTEVAFHGLHHVHRGPQVPVEFQAVDGPSLMERKLREAMGIFKVADLPVTMGFQPPGWSLTEPLLRACDSLGMEFVASARDIQTPVRDGAVTAMSGLRGAPLFHPAWLDTTDVVHFTSNFQATSPVDRAMDILEAGGVLAVKAHIIKNALGHVAKDGVDELYMNYLDAVFREIERRFGDRVWWTSMGQMAQGMRTKGRGMGALSTSHGSRMGLA